MGTLVCLWLYVSRDEDRSLLISLVRVEYLTHTLALIRVTVRVTEGDTMSGSGSVQPSDPGLVFHPIYTFPYPFALKWDTCTAHIRR
jgi:hypothetical protein